MTETQYFINDIQSLLRMGLHVTIAVWKLLETVPQKLLCVAGIPCSGDEVQSTPTRGSPPLHSCYSKCQSHFVRRCCMETVSTRLFMVVIICILASKTTVLRTKVASYFFVNWISVQSWHCHAFNVYTCILKKNILEHKHKNVKNAKLNSFIKYLTKVFPNPKVQPFIN